MSGRGVWLFTDEDVDARLAPRLVKQGYDVLSCRDAGRAHRQYTDDLQLGFAVSQRRAILVHNIADYMALDAVWRTQGRKHYGIICVSQIPIGALIRRVTLHLDRCDPVDQYNTVQFLPL